VYSGTIVQGYESNIFVAPFSSYPAFYLHGNSGLHFQKVNDPGA
jgi:hypothetical protein